MDWASIRRAGGGRGPRRDPPPPLACAITADRGHTALMRTPHGTALGTSAPARTSSRHGRATIVAAAGGVALRGPGASTPWSTAAKTPLAGAENMPPPAAHHRLGTCRQAFNTAVEEGYAPLPGHARAGAGLAGDPGRPLHVISQHGIGQTLGVLPPSTAGSARARRAKRCGWYTSHPARQAVDVERTARPRVGSRRGRAAGRGSNPLEVGLRTAARPRDWRGHGRRPRTLITTPESCSGSSPKRARVPALWIGIVDEPRPGGTSAAALALSLERWPDAEHPPQRSAQRNQRPMEEVARYLGGGEGGAPGGRPEIGDAGARSFDLRVEGPGEHEGPPRSAAVVKVPCLDEGAARPPTLALGPRCTALSSVRSNRPS